MINDSIVCLVLNVENSRRLLPSPVADFSCMVPKKILLVFWDPAFDEDVLVILLSLAKVEVQMTGDRSNHIKFVRYPKLVQSFER